ncbi:large extracellular alpha-helical protein [Hahella sp. CCB-MM4]|uniref:alpha-2-macroglobulin family protein n=1 Tax=Hahella sp. (strain CCB-MM4) TaxID=1926491 RepID=UPI000B9BBA75|nr:MG2 domain-containing protein [Hahella sp. CCB-MM4]OZG75254.1 large extracellular alpha-helical protein [Hahella sp. CCB-MM4]
MDKHHLIAPILGLFMALVLAHSASAATPSFDCSKASQYIEELICQSDELAQLDSQLAARYKKVREKLPADARDSFKDEQLDWLRNRNQACNLQQEKAISCLQEKYRERNADLAELLAFDSADRPDDKALRVLRITPKGNDVQAGQQIVFQFDRPVVPIGRMERDAKDIPVSIQPQLKCEWRWLNTSALACQLRDEDRMQPATRYTVTMKPGIATTDGDMLAGTVKHHFTTVRPKVSYTRFINWLSPGSPLIQVTFNQPVTKSSVETSLFMKVSNDSEGGPVNIVAFPDDIPRNQAWWRLMLDQSQGAKVDDRLTQVSGEEARRIWIVEPKRELPLDQTIWLDVAPGLKSSEGLEAGVENRTVVSFDTYPEFSFVGLRCTPKGEENQITIPLDTLAKLKDEPTLTKRCAPLSPVALVFSSPVVNSMVKHHVTFAPRLDGNRTDYDPWENTQDWTSLTSPHRSGRVYQIWLPELLKAYQEYAVAINSDELQDEFGRHLSQPIDFHFYTGHREPNLRLAHNYAVLEKDVESDIPLYVTNLNKVAASYDRLGSTDSGKGLQTDIPTAKAEDISYALPMGVRELLNNDSGVLFASLHPDPVPPDWYRDPEILAQVTPYQVHFKFGHFNSLAWVTRFDNGLPVKNAKVSLWKGSYENLPGLESLDLTAQTDDEGLAELPGLAELDPDLKLIWGGERQTYPGFFVKVEHDQDMALVPLNSDFTVRGGGVYPQFMEKGGHTHAWGATAQGVYKLGDKVQFKIYVRDQSNKNWVSPEKAGYELQVYDPQSKVVFEKKNITLNEFGAFDGEFKVPEQGAVGWYQFQLMPAKKANEEYYRFTWTPMSVLVSDFTPAPFKVKTELNGDLFKANDQVEITSLATLHSGGPFTEAEIRLTARLNEKPFRTNNPLARGFTFGSSSGKYLNSSQSNLLDLRGKLDNAGEYVDAFTLPETEIYFGTVIVEAAVKDERGKFVAASTAADYAGRNRFVGLRNTSWIYKKGESAKLESLVVDQEGNLVPGVDINITINHREYKASRVKGPGNAYLTQNIMEWVEETQCALKSTKSATICEFKPAHPGYYQFVASIKDENDKEHSTMLFGWVTGSGNVVWDQTNDATLQIVPAQTEYKIGDTARYLIKNPYPGAKALVTVERYGVLDSWLETLDSSTPVIEFPVKPEYLPGFYLSVVVVSPRVEKPLGPNKVDLGKPSYRMGYLEASVSDPFKKLDIQVTTDKEVYKPRDKVKAKIKVSQKQPSNQSGYEIAVAVVDESVLALNRSGERYYDPYSGFNRLDALDVYNYSLISRLVGRQKFEKKGANPGGDGASYSQIRSQFKFVSYWNPSITPNADGEAEIEFEVPDNLTGWRIFAFAVTPDDRMGLGDVNFKVNRPTELRPVMPNQVIEGDQFKAGFNIMNRTDKPRTLKLNVAVKGPLTEDTPTTFEYDVEVAPYQRQNIWIPLATKGNGELTFIARAGDQVDRDAVEHKLTVNKRRSLETAATYGTTTKEHISEAVQVPEGIYTDVGYIGATLSPTVIGNIDGALQYMRDYPHQCWEQRLTRAVVARSYVELKEYVAEETKWPHPQEDIANTLNVAANFQAPNGGMAYWIPSNSYVSPYLSAYTAMAFNWLRQSGYSIPEAVEERLHKYLLNLLRKDEFPTFYSKGMSSSVRAVALAALSESGKISQDDILRYGPQVSEMDLFGKSHFLKAAINTKGAAQNYVGKTVDDILGYASQTGGKFQFNEPWDDSYKYVLATPLRSNCAVLSSLLSAQEAADLGDSIADIPFKLVRSITQSRGNRDHWENTQENVFCLNALIEYAAAYETKEPSMKVSVSFDGKVLGEAPFTSKADPMVTISRPMQEDDPGRSATIDINKEGTGRLYYSARIAYDLTEDNAARINSGIEIRREYSIEKDGKFVLLASPMDIQRGDLVKVTLFVSVPTARHFVVVNDPIPGGLEPVNTDLATASQVDADKGDFKMADGSWFYQISDWSYYGRYFWSFYHKELRHDAARFYADYLPAGNYLLSYTAQAIAEGDFSVMPSMAEEMYDPDVYGKGLPAKLRVAE